jgi:signal transduction histidine kinase/CheY-like chemotaxis protein
VHVLTKPVVPRCLVASVGAAAETSRLRRAAAVRGGELARPNDADVERLVDARTHELRAAARMKDEFLAVMSHELRTPLTAILGWARMLQTGSLPPDQQDKAIAAIDRNARSQAQLIEDLLDASRMITGTLGIEVERVDPIAVLDTALAAVVPTAQGKGIELEPDIECDIPWIAGDAQRLQQVIWNLLSNAVKFTPEGGRVVIKVRHDSESLFVRVSDTGIGIQPTFLPYVFERFRQERSSDGRRGLGLGLAIVKHLVALHGGTIEAESAGEGLGASFTVRLPVAGERAAELPRRPRVTTSPVIDLARIRCLEGVHVLLVEDEADARELLTTVLNHAGATVESAGSAAEAREAFTRRQPDVLLCDLGLPGEDGCALMRSLRMLPPERGGAVPALALTAYAAHGDRLRAIDAGFHLHVAKPGPPDLAFVLANLLQDPDSVSE